MPENIAAHEQNNRSCLNPNLQSLANVLERRSRVSPQQILTTVKTRIIVDKTIYRAKPHSIC